MEYLSQLNIPHSFVRPNKAYYFKKTIKTIIEASPAVIEDYNRPFSFAVK